METQITVTIRSTQYSALVERLGALQNILTAIFEAETSKGNTPYSVGLELVCSELNKVYAGLDNLYWEVECAKADQAYTA